MNDFFIYNIAMETEFTCVRDGLTIRGIQYKEKEGKCPTVILSHGFMANQSMCKTYARVLANMGYIAYTFDFCGGGLMSKSDGLSQNMTILTEVKDLKTVLQYVKTVKEVDENNISLLGCSQGGFVSALVAKEHPEIKNLILFYPALCIPDDARAGKMLGFHFNPKNMPELLSRFPMKIGKNYAQVVINWDYKEIIKGYKGKTIFIHGTKDKIVNIQYAREARKSYENCHYYEIAGGTHMFFGKYDKEAIQILINEMK